MSITLEITLKPALHCLLVMIVARCSFLRPLMYVWQPVQSRLRYAQTFGLLAPRLVARRRHYNLRASGAVREFTSSSRSWYHQPCHIRHRPIKPRSATSRRSPNRRFSLI